MGTIRRASLGHASSGKASQFSRSDEEAGAREAFADAALYDFEYRRRRADVNFYRGLARDRMEFEPAGPILDLACGSGRLLVPLLRDGHAVVGVDLSSAMLAETARKVARLSAARRARALLVRGDLRSFAMAPRFALAIAAFHSVQHLVSDADLLRFFRRVRAALGPRGWFAFDVLPPDPVWLGRDPDRRWARTMFHHPKTRERLVYTVSQTYDPDRRALHMRIHYQPVDKQGQAAGRERIHRLCHRQLWPADVESLLARAGFRLVARLADFHGRTLDDDSPADEHVYVSVVR
jgi:SAM-dependent methyltransferase